MAKKLKLTGDENADWIKLADPEFAKQDQEASEEAVRRAHRRELKRTNRLQKAEDND